MSFFSRSACLGSIVVLGGLCTAQAAPVAFEFDSTHTYPHFMVNHLGFSDQAGSFTETSGTMLLDLEQKSGSQLNATIQAASLFTGFSHRDEQLKSKNFFNVAQFSTVTVTVDKFNWQEGAPAKVPGKLTLLGISKPIDLTINFKRCGERASDKKFVCGAMVSTQIKRSEWGMKAFLPAISDDVTIMVQVEAARK